MDEKTMTIRQAAEAIGAAHSTVAAYAKKAGWTENGKKTLLTEEQVTIILEAMKQAQHNQTKDTFQASIEGIETSKSRAIRLAILAEKRLELEKQFNAELEAEIDELRKDLKETHKLLDKRTAGLETIQRIAEAGGLLISDKEDTENLYRRRR